MKSREEFENYIESLGFKEDQWGVYTYEKCVIDLYSSYYDFFNGLENYFYININDLEPLKKIERSIKLKKLLSL